MNSKKKTLIVAEKLFPNTDNVIKSFLNYFYIKRIEKFLNSLNSDHIEVISNSKNIISKNSIYHISLDQEAYKYKNNFEARIKGESPYSYILFKPEQFKSAFASRFDKADPRQNKAKGSLLKKASNGL